MHLTSEAWPAALVRFWNSLTEKRNLQIPFVEIPNFDRAVVGASGEFGIGARETAELVEFGRGPTIDRGSGSRGLGTP